MSLVSRMSKDSLDLVILFLLSVRVDIIAWMGLIKLLKVLNVVGIVEYFDAPGRGPQLVTRQTRFLLLFGPSAVLRIRV